MRFPSKIATAIKACLIITLMTQQVAVGAVTRPTGVAGKGCSETVEAAVADNTGTILCSGCGCCEIKESDRYCPCCSEKKEPEPQKASCCSAGDDETGEVPTSGTSETNTLIEAIGVETRGCTCIRNRAPTQPSESPSSLRSVRDQLVRQPDATDSRTVFTKLERHIYPVVTLINPSNYSCAQRALCIWQL